VNFFDVAIPERGERFDTLLQQGRVRVERIVSGHLDKVEEFCQEEDEWVILCSGWALLEMDGKRYHLKRGDFLHIPAKTPHKLLKAEPGTFWLAIHFEP